MDRRYFFERNLLALSAQNPSLCARLTAADTTLKRYKLLESASGETVPALVDAAGSARPLHSIIDPKKEAERLASTLINKDSLSETVFVVFLGLGAGLAQEAALQSGNVSGVLVIDFDINGIAELLSSREYVGILKDPRFTLLVDPSAPVIESALAELYLPALCGGIRVMPLRVRTEMDRKNFGMASEVIQQAIGNVSSDYSVQAHFGMRWFANIIRNLGAAGEQNRSAPLVREAAICAAGPSLDMQIPFLLDQKSLPRLFVISADTALPALLHHGIKPDAVVSIDCQHISYYHFIGSACRDIPLFLDIASPPLLSGFSDTPFFFSGGHPLAAYISQEWRPLPLVDTSGGNVAYVCLSLAESLGAQRITVYGADFSYPSGRVYARGTYLRPFFERSQERRSPLEAKFSSFLYRSPFVGTGESCPGAVCYETEALRFYRRRFEEKASAIKAEVNAAQGLGIPLVIRNENTGQSSGKEKIISLFTPGKARMGSSEFLVQYRRDIDSLPARTEARNFTEAERRVFTTLLPQMAAIKHRRPELTAPDLIAETKHYCCKEIDRLIH